MHQARPVHLLGLLPIGNMWRARGKPDNCAWISRENLPHVVQYPSPPMGADRGFHPPLVGRLLRAASCSEDQRTPRSWLGAPLPSRKVVRSSPQPKILPYPNPLPLLRQQKRRMSHDMSRPLRARQLAPLMRTPRRPLPFLPVNDGTKLSYLLLELSTRDAFSLGCGRGAPMDLPPR